MRRLLGLGCALAVAMCAAAPPCGAEEPPTQRVEARSTTLLAVALVKGDRMTLHLSRPLDNAPVRDAVVDVLLRGVLHPTVAEADGSYTLRSRDLSVPGPAAIEFQVTSGGSRELLEGALQIADDSREPGDKNGARQLWWWVLNFAVCTGFLILWSRRRKAAADDP